MSPLLEINDLSVCYPGGAEALRGVSFELERGDKLAIVGESGAGKSTLASCLGGLIQPPEAAGSVRLDGQELIGAQPEQLRSLRWTTVAIALQGAPFNPVATIGSQVAEPLRVHAGLSREKARLCAEEAASEVLLDPALLERYPHEVSGGELRRAMLAMAVILDPALVVLDEPTAGVDPATKEQLVGAVLSMAERRGFALIVISHDLADAARLGARTVVLYAGAVVEQGSTERVMGEPAHPYTWALLNAYPVMSTTKDLRPIRGRAPDPRAVPAGCSYHPRCTQAEEICWSEHPPLVPSRGRLVACHFGGCKTLLAAVEVSKTYRSGRSAVQALREVSFSVAEGEAVGLIGPSGSGKSTLARIITGRLAPDSGHVMVEGELVSDSHRKDARDARRRLQLVMQDPNDALSPRLTVEQLVREPLDIARTGDADSRRAATAEALSSVGLPSSGQFLQSYTHALSGGQLQRVALARALVTNPKLIVADEPTAMLDASEQARLLVVLRERQVEMGLGLVLVSHDMAVVRKVCDRIVVLHEGRVVEEGPSHLVSSVPVSDTTRRLIAAAPAFAAFDAAASPPPGSRYDH